MNYWDEDQATVMFQKGRKDMIQLLYGHDRYIPREEILLLDERVEERDSGRRGRSG